MRRLTRRELASAIVVVPMVFGAFTAPASRAGLDALAIVLLAAAAASVPLRHRAPRLVLAFAAVCLVVYEARGYPGFTLVLPVLFALYTNVRIGRRVFAGGTVAAILLAGFIAEQLSGDRDELPAVVLQRWFLLVGWMVAASVLGEVFRQVEQRALDAERNREELARRRADEERLRIARELHDSLTHSISIIKVQAGVAVHLARKRAEPVPAALVAIQEASGEAMRELRATLEVLRSDTAGLHRLDDLVEGTRRIGLPVTVQVSGDRRELPEPVDRAAYRIVQEALTNVTRHAGAATVTVHLAYRDDGLTVRIDDDGCGGTVDAAAPGVGLAGMRERVTALGGSLRAGPRDDGGFRVHAELPIGAAS
jgi:signal transduction histidine kinase